jgi:hypothetical protein
MSGMGRRVRAAGGDARTGSVTTNGMLPLVPSVPFVPSVSLGAARFTEAFRGAAACATRCAVSFLDGMTLDANLDRSSAAFRAAIAACRIAFVTGAAVCAA